MVIIHRVLDNPYLNTEPDETLLLITIGRSPILLRDLITEARAHYLESRNRKTTIHRIITSNFQKCWDNGRSAASRDINTVIMDDKVKDLILNDITEYLNPTTARWYEARGLPYRRGYLFYGPPGTGKTSLTQALAGKFKLNLYIFNLGPGGGVTDETLGQLFQALPKKCIVLLEDIDCIDCAAFGRATNSTSFGDPPEEPEKQEEGTSGKKDSKEKLTTHSSMNMNDKYLANHKQIPQISFSGLLNAIDGVASQEGRILIMTTNSRERLDSALIRPGRVDIEIEFGYASKETIRGIFTVLYNDLSIWKPESIESLAETFANAVPSNVFTPAELQGFLIMHKNNPHLAIQEVEGWLKDRIIPQR